MKKYRDISILDDSGDQVWLVACDSVAAIGEKLHDQLSVSLEMTAQSMVRVALMEVLSLKAQPQLLVYLSNNEWEPTTRRALAAMQEELAKAGLADLAINGSSEDNMTTSMTAMGVTLLAKGHRSDLLMAKVQPGDWAFLLGRPLVGQKVISQWEHLLSYQALLDLMNLPVSEVVPIGSQGAYQEALQVAAANQLHFTRTSQEEVLDQSAGPATAFLVVGPPRLQEILKQQFTTIWKVGEYRS